MTDIYLTASTYFVLDTNLAYTSLYLNLECYSDCYFKITLKLHPQIKK